MHTLVSQLTTTFVDDAIELVKGFGKIIVHIATAHGDLALTRSRHLRGVEAERDCTDSAGRHGVAVDEHRGGSDRRV